MNGEDNSDDNDEDLANVTFLRNLALFLLVTAAVAYGTLRYMVDTGSALTTRHIGPWTIWANAARADADPYTRAHFARTGALPLSSRIMLTYHASSDEEGYPLRSRCDYEITGSGPAAQWWSLSLFTSKGRLIENPARRHSFTSQTVLRGTDGSYTISIAREARAGNWLPSRRAGKLMVRLLVQQPRYIHDQAGSDEEERELPSIRRIKCR